MKKKDETAASPHWLFPARFRKNAFGWKGSRLASQRIREALSELKKAFRVDPVYAVEGSVRFIEKLVGAIEQIDSSSGAIGTAVNKAILEILELHRKVSMPDKIREVWLDRLWQACMEDEMPYLEPILENWGDFCVTGEVASKEVDRLTLLMLPIMRDHPQAWIKGLDAFLSSLVAAGRHRELLDYFRLIPKPQWYLTKYGVRALLAENRIEDARGFAAIYECKLEAEVMIARNEEEFLIGQGDWESAYKRYGIRAGGSGSYLSQFNAIIKRYPGIQPERILRDLVASTPHDPGRWFTSAKKLKLYDLALDLAQAHPCEPRTLIRASENLADSHPLTSWKLALAAVRWIIAGRGYEITAADLSEACSYALWASENAGQVDEMGREFRELTQGKSMWAQAAEATLGRLLAFPEYRRTPRKRAKSTAEKMSQL